MKRVISILLALVVLASLAACGSQSAAGTSTPASTETSSAAAPAAPAEQTAEEEVITLAVVAPMTGQDAEYGNGYKVATSILADKWNEAGGCAGKKVVLKFFDDKGSPEEAASVAEQVVADESITAVIGHFSSSCSMAAAPVYQEHSMLQVAPCASHEGYTKLGDWMWRVSPLSADEGNTIADFVGKYWKAEKVGQLILNNDWGAGIAETEAAALKEINPDIEIIQEFVVDGNDDYGPIITNFLSAGVDAVICDSTYAVTAPFVRQIKEAAPDLRVTAHVNCCAQQVIDILGEYADGYYCSANWSPCFTDEQTPYFLEQYAARTNGGVPIGDTAQVFDAISVLLQAIDNCGSTDREAIRAELAEIEYVGLTGIINFDENRESHRSYGMVFWNSEAGEWQQNTEWKQ